MAALWEMLVGAAIDSTDPAKGPDIAGAWAKGAQLAQQREQLRLQREELQQKKQAVEGAKMEKFVEALQKGAAYEGQARTNYYNKWLPTFRDSLGLTDMFPDDAIKHVTADDKQLARLNTIVAQVRDPNNPLTEAEAIALIRDPVRFADVPPEVLDEKTNELAKAAVTKIQAKAQMAGLQEQARRQIVDIESTGTKTVAKGIGEEFVKYEAIGGSAGMDKTESALKNAIKQLKSGAVKTGGIKEQLPYGGDVRVLARTNKPLKALMDNVLSTQNIKALSGDPNPTQAQIDAINSRILDPAADNATNIAKLQAELKRVQTDRKRKEAMFSRAGYMKPRAQAGGQETEAPTEAPATAPAGGAQRTMQDFENPNKVKLIRAYVQKGDAQLQEIAQKYGVSAKTLLKLLQE